MEIADSYDVIVIGSGIGGLTSASLLSRLARKRVLVLERHFKLGGFTHSFQRKRFSWDPGLHYVGQMNPGSPLRSVFDLVTEGGVDWAPMPAKFERFVYPDFEFTVDSDRRRYIADLQAAFPSEAGAIARYFTDVKAAAGWYQRHMAAKIMPAPVGRLLELRGRKLALTLTADYLAKHFRDGKLRALLASQWGDYGLPPSRSPFAVHALIVDHYLRGAWYPVGGGGSIAASAAPVIEAAGGACVVNAEVEEILVERGRATGVRVKLGQGTRHTFRTVRAPLVISDAGADMTYTRLLPAALRLRESELVAELPQSVSAVQLFLGLDRDPRELGIRGENLWIASVYDHDAAFEGRNDLDGTWPAGCFVVFPSVKDPRARAHTAEIITLVDTGQFTRWSQLGWKHRGDEYEALKQKIGDDLLSLADRHVPGLRDSVVFSELASPLSLAHFTGTRSGGCYGLAVTPERLRARWLGVRTPVRGLLLTGSDVGSPGVAGAMMGGVLSAASVLGPTGFMRIMRAASSWQPSRVTTEAVSAEMAA
ncbi:MAG TPA: NAD(P)/FAD-dependent oxidoreductase [Candidatus Solibacter sp.]|jgi:all-trans-retinol 13,14-reductase|nr:NAD(P)/FAD-dependent oxidoreductase [Candidatus Solibacter sp.]